MRFFLKQILSNLCVRDVIFLLVHVISSSQNLIVYIVIKRPVSTAIYVLSISHLYII